MRSHQTRMDKERFGPWAIVTGASSGIGKEFARQLAASGLNLVLVARRRDLLDGVGQALAREYGIAYRAVGLDLSDEGFIDQIEQATHDLDVGLLVSNAGAVLKFGTEMLAHDREDLHRMVRLNSVAHLDLAHHIGQRLVSLARFNIQVGASPGQLN